MLCRKSINRFEAISFLYSYFQSLHYQHLPFIPCNHCGQDDIISYLASFHSARPSVHHWNWERSSGFKICQMYGYGRPTGPVYLFIYIRIEWVDGSSSVRIAYLQFVHGIQCTQVCDVLIQILVRVNGKSKVQSINCFVLTITRLHPYCQANSIFFLFSKRGIEFVLEELDGVYNLHIGKLIIQSYWNTNGK